MTVDVRVVEDADALAVHAARLIVEELRSVLDARGAASLCLSGGSTPKATYERIASHHRSDLPWERVSFLFGDERCVPVDDDASNARMAWRAMLQPLGVPAGHVLHIEGEHGAALGSELYEARLRAAFTDVDVPRIDILLLGIGSDGHTASLFPGNAALDETQSWTSTAHAPSPPHERITLTFPVLVAARRSLVLVAGAGKASVVAECLRHLDLRPGDTTSPTPPAARVVPTDGHLTWMLDESAAG